VRFAVVVAVANQSIRIIFLAAEGRGRKKKQLLEYLRARSLFFFCSFLDENQSFIKK